MDRLARRSFREMSEIPRPTARQWPRPRMARRSGTLETKEIAAKLRRAEMCFELTSCDIDLDALQDEVALWHRTSLAVKWRGRRVEPLSRRRRSDKAGSEEQTHQPRPLRQDHTRNRATLPREGAHSLSWPNSDLGTAKVIQELLDIRLGDAPRSRVGISRPACTSGRCRLLLLSKANPVSGRALAGISSAIPCRQCRLDPVLSAGGHAGSRQGSGRSHSGHTRNTWQRGSGCCRARHA